MEAELGSAMGLIKGVAAVSALEDSDTDSVGEAGVDTIDASRKNRLRCAIPQPNPRSVIIMYDESQPTTSILYIVMQLRFKYCF